MCKEPAYIPDWSAMFRVIHHIIGSSIIHSTSYRSSSADTTPTFALLRYLGIQSGLLSSITKGHRHFIPEGNSLIDMADMFLFYPSCLAW